MNDPMKRVLGALKGVKQRGKGWVALCPAHEDHRPSLDVNYGKDGESVVTYCQVGCSQDAVRAAAGLKYKDYFPDRFDPYSTPVGRAEAVYPYVDETGLPLFEVVRAWDAKAGEKWMRNRVVDPTKESGFRWNLKGIEARPLFRLPRVIKAVKDGREIWICEGEKDVLRLESLGEVATCNHGGSGKWRAEMNRYFKGATVNIVADLDKPGVAHAFTVADNLQGVAEVVNVLAPKIGDTVVIVPDHGKDLTDHFDAGGTLTDFRFLDRPEGTNGHTPGDIRTGANSGLVQATVGFRPVLLRTLVDSLGEETEAADWIAPGIVAREVLTMLGGLPKCGKTTALAYLAHAVATGGSFWGSTVVQAPVCWINLETSPRLAAWKFRNIGATDAPIFLWSGSNRQFTLDDLAKFVETEGVGLVVIDSLSRLWGVADENDNVQTGNAVVEVIDFTRAIAAGTALVHHHRKSQEGASVSAFRGGNATAGVVDILIGIKKRSGGGRTVQFDSRYDESPDSIVVDIRDGVYAQLGDERTVQQQELQAKVLEALGREPLTSAQVSETIKEPQTSVRRALDTLYGENEIGRSGGGKKGDAYRFTRAEIHSTSIDGGAGGMNNEVAS